MRRAAFVGLLLCLAVEAATYPEPAEGDWVVRDFRFSTGESLPALRLHYTTLGAPVRDGAGVVRNAVLILHGTGGSGRSFLTENFAGHLFGAGQLLDAAKYYLILPDGIGHGKSSKPSDGLHARFPRYTYDDMVRAHYRLLTEKLGVQHLRLVMGTSMGGMQTWMWGEMYPDFMDALMPLASVPGPIAGRNRMLRKMILDAIRNDPEYENGDYRAQPHGLVCAIDLLTIMVSSPLQMQKQYPTRDDADRGLERLISARLPETDANDMAYAFDASREYDPSGQLERIRAPLLAVNSADDQVNPPELGIVEREIKRVKRGRFVLLPISDQTRGHGTHSLPAVWGSYLEALMRESGATR